MHMFAYYRNLSILACTGREILCQNKQDVRLHSVKHMGNDKMCKKIQCRITQVNGLLRCRIR